MPCTSAAPRFLAEVREFIRDKKAYNKHDTGWAKGTLSEDYTTPPSSRSASSAQFVGGAPAGTRPFRGWLIPRIPYSGLVPQGNQTAVLATRPHEGDVCQDVVEPRCGLRLHAQGYRRGPLGRT